MEASHHNPKPLLSVSFSTGTATKARHQSPGGIYRECLKNHAASLGGHALDGCMEYMASPTSTPTRPSSITCAACGCHRNFHRRLSSSEDHYQRTQDEVTKTRQVGEEEGHEDEENHSGGSGPHMLMALSAGGRTGTNAHMSVVPTPTVVKKRFRTRFSRGQKERMLEVAQRMGWRMPRRDEGLVEEWCREIGVSRSVFKVWMHNNKSSFKHGQAAAAGVTMNGGDHRSGGDVRDGQVVDGSP